MTREEFVAKLVTLQADNSAPIEISIGHIADNGMIIHDTVVIKKAPPKVFDLLKDKDLKCGRWAIDNGGVTVYFD